MGRLQRHTDGALYRWMEANNLRSNEIADALGLSRSTISLFCTAAFYPSRETAERLIAFTHGGILEHGLFGNLGRDVRRRYKTEFAKGAEMIRLGRQRQREMERKGRK